MHTPIKTEAQGILLGGDPLGGERTAEGLSSAFTRHYSIAQNFTQVPNSAELDFAALAAASVVTIRPNGNGTGAHDPEPDPTPRFTPIPADKLKDLPPVAWLVKNEIPKLGLTLIYGPTGGGKSFVTLDYAFRIAQTRPVIYVAGEGAAGYAPRVLAWEKHHAQGAGQLFFVGQAVNLLSDQAVTDFIAAITPLSPALVIVDTLARCLVGGDENAARDMGLAVEAADRIKRAIGEKDAGGAVILVHHSTKAGNTERGSGALKAACDQVIRLDNDDDLLTLSCEKAKDATAFDPRNLRLLPIETGRQTEDGEPETSCAVIPADRVIMSGTITPSARKVLVRLSSAVFSEAGARTAALQEATEMKRSTLYNALDLLLEGGYITQDAKGEPFRITETGKKAVQQV